MIDRRLEGLATHFVGTDDRLAGMMATEHLIQIGRRRIAHIAGTNISTSHDRFQGYRNALLRHGLAEQPQYMVRDPHADDPGGRPGYDTMASLLALKPRPDAVFCFNDSIAIGAMEAVLDAGLEIPGDIAVIGCGNLTYSRMLRVPLSTVDQNTEGLGEQAAALALEIAASKDPIRPRTILQNPVIVERASTVRVKIY